MRRLSALIAPLLLIATACHAAPYCRVMDGFVVLGNAEIRCQWAPLGPTWATLALTRGDDKDAFAIAPSEEFTVKLYRGATIRGSDCKWSDPQVATGRGQASVTFIARHASGLQVAIRYWVKGDQPFMRKSLTLTGSSDTVVDELEVEALRADAPTSRGGYGQPVFLDSDWYLGLEYPAGYNDVRATTPPEIVLHHFPGRAIGAGLTSKTAVIGVAPKGLAREIAFNDYLNTVRIQPRSFTQYNSWYDLQGGNLTIPNLLSTYHKFKTNLLEPYGLKMDAFVPDDGWQNYGSIWMPDAKRFPEGFRPLSDGLERDGSHLGIWMPLNGTNLDVEWGRARGCEVSDAGRFYCIVGPKYNAEIRRQTEHLIRDGRLNYFKHDFNGLQCSAPGHGHLPDRLHGHEASLDAEIELLAWERHVNPAIFLNITSNVWLSPWWLMYADSIWMCASDNGYERSFPQLSPREWDMSYRDAHFYGVYRRDKNLVPLSALMTHGIIHGQLCRLGGDQETLREFSDMTVLYYARGVQLKELYITPDMMDKPRWEVLGAATRWAVENAQDLRNTVMIGGDLRRGEPYGYVHWNGEHGIIALRNPAPGAATIRVPFDQSVFYRGKPGLSFHAAVIYPYSNAAPVAWTSGRERAWDVPGCSVMLIDVRRGPAKALGPREPASPPLAASPKAEVAAESGLRAINLSFQLPAEEMPRCDLYLILRAPGEVDFSEVQINGAAAKSREGTGPGWRLRSFDLRSFTGKTVSVVARLPAAGDRPFSASRARVEAWVIADRPRLTKLGHTMPVEYAPLPISQEFRRDSVRLLEAVIERKPATEHVNDADLTHLKAARLRLEVFDVNGQPEYADKWITLNGEKLARVPANRGELSAWEEAYVDVPAAQVARLVRNNTVTIGNAGGDCYKVRGLALSLQRSDGTWVATSADDRTYTSVADWAYFEGTAFEGDKSPQITISIP